MVMDRTAGTPSAAEATSAPSGLVRWMRIATIATAWIFAACVVVQVFLAGAMWFESAAHISDHRTFGEMIGTFTILAVVFAVLGRLPLLLIGMAVALFFGYGFQWMFAAMDNGWVASLHAVNALVLFWLSVELARRTTALPR